MRKKRIALVACHFAVALAVVALPGSEPPDASRNVAATPEQILKWVRQLNADAYLVRAEATTRLIAAGSPAVAPLGEAIAGGSWEVSTRGIYILQEMSLSSDETSELTALEALEKVAKLHQASVAGRASEALGRLKELRQQRAAEIFAQQGARILPEHEERDLFHGSVLAIELGPEWRGKESDLRRLKWMRDIQQVTLVGDQVTDSWLAHLVGMENLFAVKIKRAGLSDAAATFLHQLQSVRCVKLLYVPIGDGAVGQLKECKHIVRMKVYGTRITARGAEDLIGTLGENTVDYRRGAFLGIAPSERGENWYISSVTPGSAAADAGLRPGDVIIRYGDATVGDFDSLTRLIAGHDVGDSVTLEVRREGQTFVRQITFGEWE